MIAPSALRRPPAARIHLAGRALILLYAALVGRAEAVAASEMQPRKEPHVAVPAILIDGTSSGRRFDGLGGVSAGASTRLLYDYPKPARDAILDLLFKPNSGAGIQILKVEMGGDMNSTCGAEPGHERIRGVVQCERGYEWWLMEEAQKRNPKIVLAALQWGAPGWLQGGFWSQDNVDYVIRWLDCAKERGLDIQYVGGWNESGFEARWFVTLARALREKHPTVGIIAADDLPHHNWRIAEVMEKDPQVNAAIDVLGQHSPGGWRSLYQRYSAPPAAHRLGKPLWASEQSALSHDAGGAAWARGINRAYIDARITASLCWAPVSAWYGHLPHADTGLILAEWPWSGHYAVGSTCWAYAHTTQFAQPGWHYLDSACGYLETGASYVTFRSPDRRDYSIVIETLDAAGTSRIQFTVAGGLSTGPVHVWSSNIETRDPGDDFLQQEMLEPVNGVFRIVLEPGHLYSLSTTTGQAKGTPRPPSDVCKQMPLPYAEDFESYGPGRLARYFSDLNGGFETAPAGSGREGMAYRQMVPQAPIVWNLAGAGGMTPTTMVGDPRWWGDYEVSADFLLEEPGEVEVMGRVSAQAGRNIAGYHLRVGTDGTWKLYSQDLARVRGADEEIVSGPASFAVGQWQTVALRMQGDRLEIFLNGQAAGAAVDTKHLTGNVALRVSPWQHAQIDNLKVTPTGPAPRLVPQAQMTARATSEHSWYRGDVYPPAFVIDGRPESFWHSQEAARAALPQAVTLDLGDTHKIEALVYQPRLDGNANGMITRYNVYLSSDGETFEKAAGGPWRVSTSAKVARWPARQARYLRLEAVEAVGGVAVAGEINIATSLAGHEGKQEGP